MFTVEQQLIRGINLIQLEGVLVQPEPDRAQSEAAGLTPHPSIKPTCSSALH